MQVGEPPLSSLPLRDAPATGSGFSTKRTSGTSAETLAVEFHEAPLVPGLWETYERVARSYGCTREFIEYFERPVTPVLALVRSRGADEARAAFLYTLEGGTARVHGRFSAPPAEALAAFAEAVFARHPRVRRIESDLIDALPDPRAVGRPVLAVRHATELRIALPATPAEYDRVLGKDLVGRSRYLERRLARELPAAQFSTREGEEIPARWIAEVVRLNRERMSSKNVRSVFSPEYEEGIVRVARRHGCVTVLHDGERVYAGTVDIRCGMDEFGWVLGHDDAIGKLRPGRLVQLATIRHCISRGCRTFHLLHGESTYKLELGGRVAPLASYVVLRTWAAARSGDLARALREPLVRYARRSVDRADALAGRAFGARGAPVKAFFRSLAVTARALGRS